MSNFIDILDRIATANHGVQHPDQLLTECETEIRGLRKSVESEHSYSRSLEVGLAKFNDLRTLRATWREEAMAWRRLADGNGTREEADNSRALTNRIFAATPEPAGSTFEMPEWDRVSARTSFDDKRDGIPDSGLVVITINDPTGKIVGYSTVWKNGPNGYPRRVSWGHRVFVKSSVNSEQYVEEPSLETRVLRTVKDTYEAALATGNGGEGEK